MPQRVQYGHDPVALDEQPLLPDLLERPPDGLHVLVREREVGVVGVDPEADPLGQLVPLVDVAQHGLAAAGVELGDAEALDVVLVGEAELLLDLELHRQAVAVPAGLARHVVALHRLVAREDVLEHAAQDVVRPGPPVRGRRALVEDERRGALAAADRLVEDVALAPALEHLLLELGERLGGVDRAVASHEQSILRARARLTPRGMTFRPDACYTSGRIAEPHPVGPGADGGPKCSTGRTGPWWHLAGARSFLRQPDS